MNKIKIIEWCLKYLSILASHSVIKALLYMFNTHSVQKWFQSMSESLNKLQTGNNKTFLRMNKRNISYKKYKSSYFEAATKVRGSENI